MWWNIELTYDVSKFQSSVTTRLLYAHSDWLKLVERLEISNQSILFQSRIYFATLKIIYDIGSTLGLCENNRKETLLDDPMGATALKKFTF